MVSLGQGIFLVRQSHVPDLIPETGISCFSAETHVEIKLGLILVKHFP